MKEDSVQIPVIVELLSRLSETEPGIGTYCGHIIHDKGIIAKTTTGAIFLPEALILKQTTKPESIRPAELSAAISTFNSL